MAPGRTARPRGEIPGSRGDAKSVSRRGRASKELRNTSKELRNTGIDILGDMLWGSHFCLFYETKQYLFDTLVPYFKAGLESNEFCVWVVSEPLTLDEARDAVRRGVPDHARYFAEGSIEVLLGREW